VPSTLRPRGSDGIEENAGRRGRGGVRRPAARPWWSWSAARVGPGQQHELALGGRAV